MISGRSVRLPPFYVMEVMERAAALEARGVNVAHMEVGEPDFETPAVVKAAALEALELDMTHYTHSLGIPMLRQSIARYYERRYGVSVDPENVIVTSGTSLAMLLVFSALLNPGEELILSNPCYACYPNICEFVGGIPRYVDVYEEDGFNYRPSEIAARRGDGVKGIVINSPSNPTGIVMGEGEMSELVEAVGGREYIVSDEIYHGLVYEGRERSILEFTDRAFVLNGFSKLYAMTGWRLGYVICPPEFVRPLQKIQQNIQICANSFVQWAGVAAIERTEAEVALMVRTYDERRRFLTSKLKEMGFGIAVEPTGAFYIFADARRFTDDSYSFCLDALEKAHVAFAPGTDFGSNGQGYVRFSYANSIEELAEGADRLARYLERRG